MLKKKNNLLYELKLTFINMYHNPAHLVCNKFLEPLVRFKELGRVKRIWYLSHMRAAMVQASLRIHKQGSRGTFRQKARSLASLNGWTCAVKICHDGMLEDTNSLDGARLIILDNEHRLGYPTSSNYLALIFQNSFLKRKVIV